MRRATIVLGALALAAAACAEANGGTEPGGNQGAVQNDRNAISISMEDYSFSVQGQAQTGELVVEFVNEGQELHDAIIGKLDEGKTLEDVQKLLEGGPPGPPPPWFDDSPPDVGIVSPGESGGVVLDAESGTYVVLCFMTDPKGVPHAAHGMAQSFEVASGDVASEIEPDAQTSLTDEGIAAPQLTSGASLLEVTNEASEPGEVLVLQFAEGKNLDDVESWFGGGQKGEPPATFLGGTHAIAPGESASLALELEPGDYTMVASFGEGKQIRDIPTDFTVSE